MDNNEPCKSNINNNNNNSNNTYKQLIGPDVTQLQEKIRTQAKRLCNFQEYISLCEKRLLQYNPQEQLPITKDILSSSKAYMNNNDKYLKQKYNDLQKKYNALYESVSSSNKTRYSLYHNNNSNNSNNCDNINVLESPEMAIQQYTQVYNKCNALEKEKQNLLSQLNNEIITNDQQRNYIEILKQAIESSLIKSGLKPKLDILKSKYYTEYPNDEYARIVLDISNIKDTNNELTLQNKLLNDKLSSIQNELNTLKQQHNKLEQTHKELNEKYISVSHHKTKIENEYVDVKSNYEKQTFDLNKLTNKNISLQHELTELNALNVNLKNEIQLLQDNHKELKRDLHDLHVKHAMITHELSKTKEFQSQYATLSRENTDMKMLNDNLTKDVNYYQDKLAMFKQMSEEYEMFKVQNEELKQKLRNATNQNTVLQNEKSKNENYYLTKIQTLTQQKNTLENILYKKELQYYEQPYNNKNNNCNDVLANDSEYIKNENMFLNNIVKYIIQHHIMNNNTKRILTELIELKRKYISLTTQIHNTHIINNNNNNNNEILTSDITDLKTNITNLELQLKQYEI